MYTCIHVYMYVYVYVSTYEYSLTLPSPPLSPAAPCLKQGLRMFLDHCAEIRQLRPPA